MKPPEFMKKRNSNMTLEKLLIFGFALAVLMAITTLGTSMWETRKGSEGDLQSGMQTLAELLNRDPRDDT